MRGRLGAAGLVVGLATWPVAAGASGDGGCQPEWKLAAQRFSCANRMVIGPGNDSRVNLLLLLRDRAGLDGRGLAHFEPEWASFRSHALFEWDELRYSLYPSTAPADPYAYDGSALSPSRCQSVQSGGEQFLAAVERNRVIPAGDRRALAEGRDKLAALCAAQAGQRSGEGTVAVADLELPRLYASREGREFGTYLAGAAAFYLEDWNGARSRFAALRTARDPWLAETARYMGARAELNAAGAVAFDEWGSFDLDAADRDAAGRAASGFAAYLEAYPGGRYAASAAGLVRRALWLQGETGALGAAYARMLERADPTSPATVDLVQEIDIKYLLEAGEAGGQAGAGPWLVAAHDLLRLRDDGAATDDGDYYHEYGLARLTAAELAAQEAAFAGHDELYGFIRANYAFYVERDYRAVLRLLPDDARRPEYGPLAFSRQVLRGMALAELKDRNEAGFWLELMSGAKGLHQRQTVELGLALAWERAGQVAKVFEPQSPIEDEGIRNVLIEHAAGPEVLRALAGLAGRPRRERDQALYVLLYKELYRGSYAAAARDLALVPAGAPLESYSEGSNESHVPLGLYVRGAFSDGYPCPALRETVAQLARDPRGVKARLCLGEFYRLNGFDYVALAGSRPAGELGSFASYPGEPVPRDRIYRDVIGEAGVSREDRAYALYRAVYCYAPSGYNSCSGEDIPEGQRRAWFRRLKGEFGDTRWGREIEYYW